ncbi:MAG TPA: hypothetical protein VLL52_02305, partial [Anaerolineae bacterium]|nr:hypothetical protein [Anaerolineae bacterium]
GEVVPFIVVEGELGFLVGGELSVCHGVIIEENGREGCDLGYRGEAGRGRRPRGWCGEWKVMEDAARSTSSGQAITREMG